MEAATDFCLTQELREMQLQMADLYLYQQQKGGIIDIEAEDLKLLVTTEDGSANEVPHPSGTSVHAIHPQPVQVVRILNIFKNNYLGK